MKIAIVVGGANCVWSDYERAKALVGELDFDTFVINDTIPVFPDYINNAVSLHPNKFPGWARERNKAGLNIPDKAWSFVGSKLVTNTTGDWGGSSGLFSVKIALELGFTKIILCGVPMDETFRHIKRKVNWASCNAFKRGWNNRMQLLVGKVKSFSGWTKTQLGEPTKEWLCEQKE